MIARAAALAALALLASITPAARADEPAQSAPARSPLEVQIVGERGPESAARDPSGASQVIRGDRLRAPGAGAADVLAEVPGVQVARAGAASDLSTASIRGATSAETPVYLAGVRINDDVTGTADLSLIPLWMIQRVEVYKSGAPLEADRLGIGGAIFFEPTLPRGNKLGAGAGVGSFGAWSLQAAGAVGDPRAGAMFAARRASAVNDYPFTDDRGTRFDPTDDRVRRRPNADYTLYDLWSIGRLRLGRGSVTSIVNGLVRDQGVTGLSIVPAESARAHAQRWLAAVSAALPCTAAADRCRVELTSSAVVTRSALRDPRRELDLFAAAIDSAGERVSEQARLRLRFNDVVALGAGLSQEFEALRLDEPGTARLRARRATSRASASLLINAGERVELNALGAVEYHATAAPGLSGDAASILQPTARAGARARLAEGADLLANAGRYVRVPTLGETYGTSPIVRGNPDLLPERGWMLDLGARLSAAIRRVTLHAHVFGFARFASDLIGFRRSSFGVIRPYNVGEARVLGAEANLGARFGDLLRADLALTALDPRDTSDDRGTANDLIPFQARLVAAPRLEIGYGPIPAIALDRAALGARLTFRGSRVADPAGLITLPAQTPVDFDLALHFLGGRVALRAVLANAFDSPLFDAVGLPLPGRSVHASTELWW